MNKIIGIDLGTTNSCAAMIEGGNPEVIINSDGDRTTPSVVGWDKNGERIVGKAALRQQVLNPKNTIYSVKRFIGRTYSDLTPKDLEGLHYDIESGEKGRPMILANGRKMLPEEISAAVLSKIKADCEKFIGSPVTQAVITVPAYFDDNQRQATKDAGAIAGLEVLRIINEPTAAAMAYGYGKGDQTTKVLVFDLGGGTFDVSILDVSNDLIQVISTAGDNHLGGDIWDSTFCEYLCDRFKNDTGVDLRDNTQAHARVLEAARNAKCDLSTATSVQISLPFIAAGPSGALNMDYDISREEFENVTAELLSRCKQPIKDALAGTNGNPIGLTINDIDEILMVGGSTRMPAVQRLVKETFGKEPCTTVNPDEVVAMGAAIQGGILNDECNGIILSDVNPMAIGIKTQPNNNSIMIEANTPIPAECTKVFCNEKANQDNVEFVLIQGENPVADGEGNKILGTAVLPADGRTLRDVLGKDFNAYEVKLETTVSYNVDGIIELHAREVSSGETIDVKIEGTTKLEQDEVMALAAAEKLEVLGSSR